MSIPYPKKIVLISSGQPSLNPRLVKEADCLADAGYHVTVIYQYRNEWATNYDKELLPAKRWNSIRVGGSLHEGKVTYWLSRIKYKVNRFVTAKLRVTTENSIARCAALLYKTAKKHKADLYIAHNLGALPAAVKAAKKHKAQCGFDAEDFHRHEVTDDKNALDFKIAKYIEDKYLKQIDYITASSPQIADVYHQIYPDKNPVIILNVFPKTAGIQQPETDKRPLKLFWFSQTVGIERGIETIAEALKQLEPENIELHLLGDISADDMPAFTDRVLLGARNVFFHEPVSPDEIFKFAAQFDIGLASETGLPLNRDICLTNKIFTYIQSGLAVIASDTQSQSALLKQYPGIGKIYQKNDAASLAYCIKHYIANTVHLNQTRQANYQLGQTVLNWEYESKTFLELIKTTLN